MSYSRWRLSILSVSLSLSVCVFYLFLRIHSLRIYSTGDINLPEDHQNHNLEAVLRVTCYLSGDNRAYLVSYSTTGAQYHESICWPRFTDFSSSNDSVATNETLL